MADQTQWRGGTTSEVASFTGAQREIIVDTDLDAIVVQDGVTPGGFYMQRKLDSVNGTFYYDDDTAGGSIADAYILSAKSNTEIPTGYFDGVLYGFTTTNSNTGSSTADFSGLGVKSIKLPDGSDPTVGQIDGRVDVIFDSSNDWLELQDATAAVLVNLPRGYLDGFITSNGADTLHDVDIEEGSCKDSTDAGNINLLSVITKQIDATWAEGTNAGGLNSTDFPEQANTWYHLFVISKDDGTVDAGWDTSVLAVNLLSDATGYTRFRRIWSNLTDASSNIEQYIQDVDDCLWSTFKQDISDTTPGTGANSATITVPIGEPIKARITGIANSGANINILISSLLSDDEAPTNTLHTLRTASAATWPTNTFEVLTDETAKIRYRTDTGGSITAFTIGTVGYTDLRGKK